ncbi:tRNA uracil 4-sulfurtransferase ThiI [Chloroflexota bacterium]
MRVILIRYGEIAIKGAKRDFFEQQLMDNIQKTLEIPAERIRLYKAQIVIDADGLDIGLLLEKLKHVVGIVWYAEAETCENDLEEISSIATHIASQEIHQGQTFAIRSRRSDKSLPFDSMKLERTVGSAVGLNTGAKVNLDKPDVRITVVTSIEGAYVISKRLEGPGGLPVGTSETVLSLISGGFDSIGASYMMARRGAQVDFLHFHVYPNKSELLRTKISPIIKKLSGITLSKLVFFISYLPFEMKVLNLNRQAKRYETVVFRRLMARVGQTLAFEYGYLALVFGDSLGQVASQTMENIAAVQAAVSLPIFRPLIGMDKVNTVELVRKIGIFEEASKSYKDCCSILSPDPVLKAYMPMLDSVEESIEVEKVVEEMVASVEVIEVGELVNRKLL